MLNPSLVWFSIYLSIYPPHCTAMALDLSHGFFFLSPSPPASSHPLCVIPCPNPRLLPPQNPHPIRPLVTCHTSHRSICNSSPPSITTMPRSAFRTFALPDSTSHTTGSVLPGPQNALHGSNTAFPPPSQTETASRESGDGNYFSDTILIEESDEKMERSAGGFYSWEVTNPLLHYPLFFFFCLIVMISMLA